ncbi:Golgi APPARATUS membrane protein TVP23 family, partial [Trichomonas vaginalis G3]|uniref:Golgi APPARATUS membrane protein TVP23 family n=1 Tax=Trichomonas vaginalis (strain ATCC PRA-98 / G3) TaxID=412133 RepID=UPI0021E5FE19
MENDNEKKDLILEANKKSPAEESSSRVLFMHISLNLAAPIILLFLTFIPAFVRDLLALISLIPAIYFTHHTFSWELVGIKCIIDKNQQPSFPHFVYSSRSLPFVATLANSNAFWLTLFISNVSFLFALVKSLISYEYFRILVLLAMEAANALSLQLLIICHGRTKTESDAVARNLLLDPHVEFQSVVIEDSSEDFDPNIPQQTAPVKLITSGGIAIPEKFAGKPAA